MLIGYMRVFKADGSQATDLQRDALMRAGVDDARFYEDHASGKRDSRPGLDACLKALRESDTLVIWSTGAQVAAPLVNKRHLGPRRRLWVP